MQVIEPNITGIKKAVKKITSGEIIFIPTDTVYGIAANPFKETAVKKIFLIKKRPISSSLILLCSNLNMAKKYAVFNKLSTKLINMFWPGPLTLILKRKPNLNISKLFITSNNTIGVRIPDHNMILEIIKKCNFPIFCTSANITGKRSHTSAKSIMKNFKNKKIAIINDGITKLKKDSTIIDLTENKINILREGYINKKEINQSLL